MDGDDDNKGDKIPEAGDGDDPEKKKKRYKLYIPSEEDREFKKRESAEAYQESR